MTFVVDNLLEAVQGRPVRHIEKNGAPYLSRYFMGKYPDGRQLWLHRFHSSDGDDALHNHAWTARSWVIVGQYSEQHVSYAGIRHQVRRAPVGAVTRMQMYRQVQTALTGSRWLSLEGIPCGEVVGPERWHRVEWVEPETWTLLAVEPGRLDEWYFADPCGHEGEPFIRMHDEILLPEGWTLRGMPTEGEDWYRKYCPCGGKGCEMCAD